MRFFSIRSESIARSKEAALDRRRLKRLLHPLPPKPLFRAKFHGFCPSCSRPISPGQRIMPLNGSWVHKPSCSAASLNLP